MPGQAAAVDWASWRKQIRSRERMELLDKGIWKFTGVTTVCENEDFDRVSELMEKNADAFIKGAFRP